MLALRPLHMLLGLSAGLMCELVCAYCVLSRMVTAALLQQLIMNPGGCVVYVL
jgi:hypothetical protein